MASRMSLRTRPLSGGSFQDARATALRERFFACGETALAPLPALQPASGLAIPGRLKLVPFKLQSRKDLPGSGLHGTASFVLTIPNEFGPTFRRVGADLSAIGLRSRPLVGAGYLVSGM